ncbi:transcriptional regulator [Candidatus Eisenbacteria bacterium]|uniref:Transcriptional regulator n=1 Tax=Eiseniibacteriota bacterium TaxID=2212470 RepID=A0ABV6YLB6_UNCEI
MSPKRIEGNDQVQSGLRGLHKLLGHRTRLGICVLLARNDRLSFRRLKQLLEETDGSLGAQLRKLEDESLINVQKEFRDRKPVSWYALTENGRSALEDHLEAMQQLMKE